MHITVRLAWHNNGWNGHICSDPEKNTYCIGRNSYPGDLIKGQRNLEWEMDKTVKGKPCSSLSSGIPACGFSINAFGSQNMKAVSYPPEWFRDDSQPAYMDIPPATICTWYYEGMYGEDVKREPGRGQKYDYDIRLQNAKDYFNQLEEGKSLLFYYANYSNPFSENDSPKYVIVGVSRLKKVGEIRYYDNVSETNKKKYAGGFVWQMPLTSNYPEEGFQIPYHQYMGNPEVLNRLLFLPTNPRNFKFATRPVSQDDALAIVERFIEITNYLIEIGDKTQNWELRRDWLLGLLSELWDERGAYPGLPEVLKYSNFNEAIPYYKESVEIGKDKEAYAKIKDYLTGNSASIPGLTLSSSKSVEVKRNWQLYGKDITELLLEVLPRFALTSQQIENIIDDKRAQNSLYCSIKDIKKNPYLLSEQYGGDDIDDNISFDIIDHGILPKPDLGLENIFPKNSAERFRALCVNMLKRETIHSFVSQTRILEQVNAKLNYLPEWKNHQFTINYFTVDVKFIEEAIVSRKFGEDNYLYLREVHEDERYIESVMKQLQQLKDIALRVEINEQHFYNLLKDSNSELCKKAPQEYDEALKGQAKVCQQIFTKPLCIISGAAGTGKTTILRAIIKSIEKAHGEGTNIVILAPTGKASERVKEKTQRMASTIHSFLANPDRGWLNDNFTLKRTGGKEDNTITNLIVDESSMIDLALFAALFKSINWKGIQRLILVGDPNQLPPIGRGKVFSDIIEWIKANSPDNLGKLDINVRQLENKVKGEGNGILELAEVYIQEKQEEQYWDKNQKEQILKKVQQGGEVDTDLDVQYWNEMTELEAKLKATIISDLEKDTGGKADPEKLSYTWSKAIRPENKPYDASYLQVLSPYRGEFYGTDYLNTVFQSLLNGYQSGRTLLEGIALFDKVIQFRNRPKSDPISAYSFKDKKNIKLDIYNGEIGFVVPHPFDKEKIGWNNFSLRNFQVKFDRRDDYSVNYGYRADESHNPPWTMFNEPVEENLELGYVISVHKAQGSEFKRVYLILPKRSSALLSMELLYTAITRAQKHLTIFAQQDITTFIELSKIEKSNIRRINSSVFDFSPIPEMLLTLASGWYENQRVISTLSKYFVRSKSEMNIANILSLKNIPFVYEEPLFAPDGSMYLPDFTINWHGEKYYWEHVGRLDLPKYRQDWEKKEPWYQKHFPGKLITTFESNMQSKDIETIIKDKLGV
ncbi:exonuclease [Dehalococcoides mccartyi]|uniref:ATP-dependent DNA helicase n=1 Tax=Dehalococcoides mccartyi TaxID=61435 RepID=UPI00071D14A1|nr:AAA family ATPase [Dehalococcoides mccartyi]KSV16608.1 exonuclease [Dehalococcoides mccartyi]